MRSMARPLASSPSPLQRPAITSRPGQMQRSHGLTHDISYTGELQRREHTTRGHRPQPARRISQREVIRRRRSNVLFVLVMANALTLFLAATTKAHVMVYGFALAFVSLCGYVYKLAQLRQYEQDSRYSEANWFNAA
jgi:hypothetical protein